MANVITDELIDNVAILAKLEISEEERQTARSDLEKMLNYFDQINELDTTGIEPITYLFPVTNVFREDVVTNGDGREASLANAPKQKDGSFVVPKTFYTRERN